MKKLLKKFVIFALCTTMCVPTTYARDNEATISVDELSDALAKALKELIDALKGELEKKNDTGGKPVNDGELKEDNMKDEDKYGANYDIMYSEDFSQLKTTNWLLLKILKQMGIPGDRRDILEPTTYKFINGNVNMTSDEFVTLCTKANFPDVYLSNLTKFVDISAGKPQVISKSDDLDYNSALKYLSSHDMLHLAENIEFKNKEVDLKLNYYMSDLEHTVKVLESNPSVLGDDAWKAMDKLASVKDLKVADYKLTYYNEYTDPNAVMPKSTFVMNLMKALDGVEYSRPLIVQTLHSIDTAYATNYIPFELAENSSYNQDLLNLGFNFADSYTVIDNVMMRDKLVFMSPNVRDIYIGKALDDGVVSYGELNSKNPFIYDHLTENLAKKDSTHNTVASYSKLAPPVLMNFYKDYNPKGVLDGTYLLQPKQFLFNKNGIDLGSPTIVDEESFLPNHLPAVKPTIENNKNIKLPYTDNFMGRNFKISNVNKDACQELTKYITPQSTTETMTELDNITGLTSKAKKKKTVFENDFEINGFKIEAIKREDVLEDVAHLPSDNNAIYFRFEETTKMDAIRKIYKAIMAYSDPRLTQLEVDTINSLYGLSLEAVQGEDRKMLEYLYAKGILNPEDPITDYTTLLTYDFGMGLIYRTVNPEARYTLKNVMTTLDASMYQQGYYKMNASVGETNSRPISPIEKEDTKNTVYIRLEEVYLMPKNGQPYSYQNNINRDYDPTDYKVQNNLFGIRKKDQNNFPLSQYSPFQDFYLGEITTNYTTADGQSRNVIWMKFGLPKDFSEGNYEFNSGGAGFELPTEVTGLTSGSDKDERPNIFYVSDSSKRSFLGVDDKFNLRVVINPVTIQGQSLSFSKFDYSKMNTNSKNLSLDEQDCIALAKFLQGESTATTTLQNEDIYEQPVGTNKNEKPTLIGDFLLTLTTPILNLLSSPFTIHADNTPASNSTQTSQNNTSVNSEFCYFISTAKAIEIDNTKLLDISGDTVKVNESAESVLSAKGIKIDVEVRDGSPEKQICIKPVATNAMTVASASKIYKTLVSVRSAESGFETLSEVYYKTTLHGKDLIMVAEDALPKFNIQMYADPKDKTKVLKSTVTEAYAVLSEATKTVIMPNEIMHLESDEPFTTVSDGKTFVNFAIIRKLFSYDSIKSIDYTINGNNLHCYINNNSTPTSGMKIIKDTSMSVNSQPVSSKPYLLSATGSTYLDLNGIGYKAPHLIKTWTNGTDKYSALIIFRVKNEKLELTEQQKKEQKENFLDYNNLNKQYHTNVFNQSSQARINLAMSNLAVDWALYDKITDSPSRDLIKENFITSPASSPYFIFFKNGLQVSLDDCPELKKQFLQDLKAKSRIGKLTNEFTYSTKNNIKFSEVLKDILTETGIKNYVQSQPTQGLYAYDPYKESILLKISTDEKTPTEFGPCKLSTKVDGNITNLNNNYDFIYYGLEEKGTPIAYLKNYDQLYSGGQNQNGSTNTNIKPYTTGVTQDGKSVAYSSIMLAPIKVSESNLDDYYKKLKNKELESIYKYFSPLSGYIYTKKNLQEGKTVFGDDKFLNFLASTADLKSYTQIPNGAQNQATNKGYIILKDTTTNLPKVYNYMKIGESGYFGSEYEESLNGKTVYIQYKQLVEGTSYIINENNELKASSKDQIGYSKQVSPVFDITNTIAKNLLASKELMKNNSNSNIKYVSELKSGDVLLLDDERMLYNIAVVSATKDLGDDIYKTYVPITILNVETPAPNPTNLMKDKGFWVTQGQFEIFAQSILLRKLTFGNGYDIPMEELVDKSSVQIATTDDVSAYIHFMNYISKFKKENYTSEENIDLSLTVFYDMMAMLNSELVNEETSNCFGNKNTEQSIYIQNNKNNTLECKALKNYQIFEPSLTPSDNTLGITLSRFDINPNLKVEYLGTYNQVDAQNELQNQNKVTKKHAVYKLVGLDTTDSQNIKAYDDYSKYLDAENKRLGIDEEFADFWDAFSTPEEIGRNQDLSAYVLSSTPEKDMERQRIHWLNISLADIGFIVSSTIYFLIIAYICLLFFMFAFCLIPHFAKFANKHKIIYYMTFKQRRYVGDIHPIIDTVCTFIVLVIVLVTTQPQFLELVKEVVSIPVMFYQKLRDFFMSIL